MADKELLSALMDGETVDKALISKLSQEPESQTSWQNYHLIGDIMRGDAPETLHWDIAGKVAAALEDEPAYTQFTTATPMVEAQPTPKEARRRLPMWLTQFGQVAVAASVSLAVIVGVQQYGGNDMSQQAGQLPVLQTIPLSGNVEPVSLTREALYPQKTQQEREAKVLEQRRQINALLQDYELQLRLNTTGTLTAEHKSLQPVVE